MANATAEQRAENAAIRAWAADNGMELKERGAIPVGIRQAYAGALAAGHQAGEPGEEEPDWDAAGDEPDPDDPFAVDDPAPSSNPAAGPSSDPGPPVTSLEEAREQLRGGTGGRVPPWAQRRGRPADTAQPGGPAEGEPRPVTAAMRKDITAKTALLLSVVAMPWAMMDPCGQVAVDIADDVAKKLTPLLAQSPAIVEFLTSGTRVIMVIELAAALQPLGVSVWSHHIGRGAAGHAQPEPAPGQPAAAPSYDYRIPDFGHVPQPAAPRDPADVQRAAEHRAAQLAAARARGEAV